MKPKRIWAMMGVVYMVIIFLLTTYWIATTTLIRGITGILLFPAAGALAAQFYNRSWLLRHGDFGVLFTVLTLFLLAWGIWQTAQFLGGHS